MASKSTGISLLKRSVLGLFLLLAGTTAIAWLMYAGIENDVDRAEAGVASGLKGPLATVKSWSPASVAAIGGADTDLVVLSPWQLGPDSREAPRVLEQVKRRADGRTRQVLARIPIASASPDLLTWLEDGSGQMPWASLGKGLADKSGRWPVAFWSTEWQAKVVGSSNAMIDRVAALGFDGVYLADADLYLTMQPERPAAESEMVGLITRIAARAREINPDFAIVLANAEELITHPAVKSAVDAYAREDLMFSADEPGRANARSGVVASLQFLTRARREGQPVLISETVEAPADVAAAKAMFRREGFVGAIQPLATRKPALID